MHTLSKKDCILLLTQFHSNFKTYYCDICKYYRGKMTLILFCCCHGNNNNFSFRSCSDQMCINMRPVKKGKIILLETCLGHCTHSNLMLIKYFVITKNNQKLTFSVKQIWLTYQFPNAVVRTTMLKRM